MLEEIETEVIRFALAHYRGQMSQMARKLGIGRSTLYRKMKDIGIAMMTCSATLRHNAGEACGGVDRNIPLPRNGLSVGDRDFARSARRSGA